jgi:topoisomerase-4 subunit A
MDLLKKELEIKLSELNEKWHYTSLEKIFFEEKIYKELEKKHEDWEAVIAAIDKAFAPFKKNLKRNIEREDILKLTEKPVRRIYKLDIDELIAQINNIENDIQQTQNDLDHLRDFTIAYFENLLKKYGKGKERKTEIRTFDNIQVAAVAIANTKLYVNWNEGFIGSGLKKDEFLFDCSDLDNIVVFRKDGKMLVTKVSDKTFVGKDIIHVEIFKKNDERTTYNLIYLDGGSGISYVKRFQAGGVTRDKEYDLTKGDPKSKVLYFSSNPNGEAEKVNVVLKPTASARIKVFDFDFAELEIKGRGSNGNQLTKYPVHKISLKEKGKSTLSGIKIYYDEEVGRLNTDGKGKLLGNFEGDDKIIALYKDGTYELTNYELTNRFESNQIVTVEKFDAQKPISCIYYDAEMKCYNAKRFLIETQTLNTKFLFIKEGEKNELLLATTQAKPIVRLKAGKKKSEAVEYKTDLSIVTEVKGWKTVGTKIGTDILSAELFVEEEPKTGELF